MNWKRGLIRIWLLVSVVWVIGSLGEAQSVIARAQSVCASASYDALTPPPEPKPATAAENEFDAFYRKKAEKSKPAPPKSAYRRLLEEGENEYDAFYRELYEKKRQRFFSMTPDQRIAVAETTCRMNHQSAAKDIATHMLVVPVGLILAAAALLIIGAVLLWVVRGFRREEART
jgi:hypothetical protein